MIPVVGREYRLKGNLVGGPWYNIPVKCVDVNTEYGRAKFIKGNNPHDWGYLLEDRYSWLEEENPDLENK